MSITFLMLPFACTRSREDNTSSVDSSSPLLFLVWTLRYSTLQQQESHKETSRFCGQSGIGRKQKGMLQAHTWARETEKTLHFVTLKKWEIRVSQAWSQTLFLKLPTKSCASRVHSITSIVTTLGDNPAAIPVLIKGVIKYLRKTKPPQNQTRT